MSELGLPVDDGWVDVQGPDADVSQLLADNPTSMVDYRFRIDAGPWVNVLGIPAAGLESRPLCSGDIDCSVTIELAWDDAFASRSSLCLVVSPWRIRPTTPGLAADVVVVAEWWQIVCWLHDPDLLLGNLLLRDECRVTGDLWLLSVVEAVVSGCRPPQCANLIWMLDHLERSARRW